MLSILLALAVTAQPAPGPAATKQAGAVLYIRSPKAALPELRAFLDEAGALAPILRPAELGRSLGGPLGVDLLSVDSLKESGIDTEMPITIGLDSDMTVTCLYAAKGGKALERIRTASAAIGPSATLNFKGVKLEGAVSGQVWRQGVASKGSAFCVASGVDSLPALKGAAEALNGAGFVGSKAYSMARGLDSPILAFFQAPGGQDAIAAFEAKPSKTGLRVKGRALSSRVALEKPKDRESTDLAQLRPDAAVYSVATLSPKTIADPAGPIASAIALIVASSCPSCDKTVGKTILDGFKSILTGTTGFLATKLDPTAATGAVSQYFMVHHAYLLPVKDSAVAKLALDAALVKLKERGAKVATAQGPGDSPHFSLGVGARNIYVGMIGSTLYLANDLDARNLALAEFQKAKPSGQSRAAVFTINGSLAAAALRRISLLDAAKSPELASLFAFGVSAGGFLKAVGPISGYAEPEGNATKLEMGFDFAGK